MPDEQTTNFITRSEYEARHSNLMTQVSAIEARLNTEQAALRADLDRKFDKLLESIEKLKLDFYTNRTKTAQWVISVLVSFLVGSGGVALLEWILHLYH